MPHSLVRFCRIFDEIPASLLDNITVNQRLGLRVVGVIFAIFCLAHLLRLLSHTEVVIGGNQIPFWPSWLGMFVGAFLSAWMWSLSSRR
jgi:hypothetical protein